MAKSKQTDPGENEKIISNEMTEVVLQLQKYLSENYPNAQISIKSDKAEFIQSEPWLYEKLI